MNRYPAKALLLATLETPGTNLRHFNPPKKESKLLKDCAIRRWLAVLFPAGSSAYLGPRIRISDSSPVKRALIFIPNI